MDLWELVCNSIAFPNPYRVFNFWHLGFIHIYKQCSVATHKKIKKKRGETPCSTLRTLPSSQLCRLYYLQEEPCRQAIGESQRATSTVLLTYGVVGVETFMIVQLQLHAKVELEAPKELDHKSKRMPPPHQAMAPLPSPPGGSARGTWRERASKPLAPCPTSS